MASQNTYTTAPDSNYPRRFPFTFPSLDSSEVYVSVAGSLKTVGASNDYTVGNYNKTSGGYIEFVSDTTRGTGTVRIYRKTDGSILKRNFQVGSAIKADDLNTANKQAIYLAEEARQEFTNLATSGTSSGFAIDGNNIAPNSITSNKIQDLEVKAVDLSSSTNDDTQRAVTTDHIRDNAVTTAKIANDNVTADKLKDSTSTDSDRAVTTNHIRDGAVTDAKLSTISGTKITPNFGSQNIITTGTLNAGTTTAGSLTVTGNTSFNDHVQMFGKDIYMGNGTIISNDSQGAFADRTGDNIDHIWHNDSNTDSNTGWNFVADGTYKQRGNAELQAGSIRCYSQDAMMFSNPSDRTINDSDMNDPIHFDTVDLEKGGTNDSNSRSRITVSQDGIYLITCCLSGSVTTHSHGDGIAICLRKNGSIFPRESAFGVESFGAQDDMEWSFTFAITEQFSANDYLEVVFRNVDVTVQATLNKGYFCVTRLH